MIIVHRRKIKNRKKKKYIYIYLGSNIVESVAESWMEAEMSWVEVGGAGWSWMEVGARFSNTHLYCIVQT